MYTFDNNGNRFHNSCIIYDGAKIGSNNYFGAFCVIYPDTLIGNNNYFVSHCSIGSPPEHTAFLASGEDVKGVIIGSNNRFSEFVTVNQGTHTATEIGSNNTLLKNAHVGHDTVIGNNCTITVNVAIAGHCVIEDYVNIGLNASLHQFAHVPTGTMLGMGCVLPKTKKLSEFMIYVGNPAKELKENTYMINKLKNINN